MCIAHIIIHMIATFVQLICLCTADFWVIAQVKKWKQTNEFTHTKVLCAESILAEIVTAEVQPTASSWEMLDEVWNAGFWKWVKRTVHISILWNNTFHINSFKPQSFLISSSSSACPLPMPVQEAFRAQPADKVPTLVISEPETLLCSLSLNVRMLSFRTVAIRQTSQSFKSPLVIFIMINSAFGVTFLFLKAGAVDITVKPMPQEVSVSIHLTTCSSITLLQVHIARCLMMMPGNTHQWR